jgi:hypothetical protein
MLRNLRSSSAHLALVLAIFASSFSAAQSRAGDTIEKAPVPAQIASAKTVFISYAGVDALSLAGFNMDQRQPRSSVRPVLWSHEGLGSI